MKDVQLWKNSKLYSVHFNIAFVSIAGQCNNEWKPSIFCGCNIEWVRTKFPRKLLVDNELLKRAYSCPSDNLVLWVDYKNVNRFAQAKLCSAQYSEWVSTVEYVDTVTQDDDTNSRAAIAFDPSEWWVIKTVNCNPFITGSKPCSMYGRNYDEDPALNRYNGKK